MVDWPKPPNSSSVGMAPPIPTPSLPSHPHNPARTIQQLLASEDRESTGAGIMAQIQASEDADGTIRHPSDFPQPPRAGDLDALNAAAPPADLPKPPPPTPGIPRPADWPKPPRAGDVEIQQELPDPTDFPPRAGDVQIQPQEDLFTPEQAKEDMGVFLEKWTKATQESDKKDELKAQGIIAIRIPPKDRPFKTLTILEYMAFIFEIRSNLMSLSGYLEKKNQWPPVFADTIARLGDLGEFLNNFDLHAPIERQFIPAPKIEDKDEIPPIKGNAAAWEGDDDPTHSPLVVAAQIQNALNKLGDFAQRLQDGGLYAEISSIKDEFIKIFMQLHSPEKILKSVLGDSPKEIFSLEDALANHIAVAVKEFLREFRGDASTTETAQQVEKLKETNPDEYRRLMTPITCPLCCKPLDPKTAIQKDGWGWACPECWEGFKKGWE